MNEGNASTQTAKDGVLNAGYGAASGVLNAGDTASNEILNAGRDANNVAGSVLTQQQSNLNPYLNLGTNAANSFATALAPGGDLTKQFSFDPSKIAENPDYQFQLQQGLDAVKAAAAATGTLGSSGTLKGLTNYAGGLASNQIAQEYQRALTTFNTNRSNTLSNFTTGLGVGQTATGQANANLGNYGSQVGANTINTAGQSGQDLLGANTLAGQFNTAAAKQAGDYTFNNGRDIEQLMLDRANARANGSLQQGKIWSGYAGGVATAPAVPGGVGANVAAAALGIG